MAASLEQSPYFAARIQRGEPVIRDAPKFDLESYIANYEGFTRLARLNYIARLCPPLALEALRIAVPESKTARDPEVYLSFTALLHEVDPSNELSIPDVEWVEHKRKENQREIERLENELRGYKNNLIKESIRMGQEDIASYYLAMSDFENSQKAFQKMRDFCTTPKHVAEMTIKLIYGSISSAQWITVQSHCHKARVMSLKPEDKERFDPAIEACSGLAFLGTEDYLGAAQTFARVNPQFTTSDLVAGINFPRAVISSNDIAVYGGLCALASMDRDQLRYQILENQGFRTFLELEPHIRRAISFFCDGKYSQCLEILEAYRNDYLLDIHLGEHVRDVYEKVRSKSIIQYFIPFSCVTLDALAAAFPQTSRGGAAASSLDIETELIDLIQSGQLNARIDTVDRLLVAPPTDARAKTQQDALDTAKEFEHTLRLKLHKTNLAQAGMELQNPKAQKGLKGFGPKDY